MDKKVLHKILSISIFVFLLILFCYFRLRPIYFQTVPYTFDQGRDFLKAAEIVREKNITFLGPATGIMGVFHGVWWYYFLTVPYFLFNGRPEGFYLAVFFIHLTAVIFFTLFLKNEFGFLIAVLFLSIVAISPYLIKISVFPISSTLSPVVILFFIFSLYQFFKKRRLKDLFLLGLSLGALAESELPFAIYYLPAVLASCLFFADLREIVVKAKKFFSFCAGLIIPFVPRILFELKNNFLQTKAMLNFIKNPTTTNVISLKASFFNRINLLIKYFVEIFYQYSSILAIIFVATVAVSVFFLSRKLARYHKKTFVFLIVNIIFLIFFITLSKNNFFWDNYLEGFHYFFIFLIIVAISPLAKTSQSRLILIALLTIYFFLNLYNLKLFITDKNKPPAVGLRADLQTVNYLYQVNKNKDFCLRIYTPPMIPFTYNYLFNYIHNVKGYLLPKEEFINNQCWYIFDDEFYAFRVTQWRKDHIPQEARLLKTVNMPNKTKIELWQI